MATKKHKFKIFEDINIPDFKSFDEFVNFSKNSLNFLAYKVEDLSWNNILIISKPGWKYNYIEKDINDFMVWIYDKNIEEWWRISYKELINLFLKELYSLDLVKFKLFIDKLEFLKESSEIYIFKESEDYIFTPSWLNMTSLLKIYKWLWAQEECNYPRWYKTKTTNKVYEWRDMSFFWIKEEFNI